MNLKSTLVATLTVLSLVACGDANQVSEMPTLTPVNASPEFAAMTSGRPPNSARSRHERASLWHSGPTSLLGDRRAGKTGDLLTVVIEIDDKAEISNSTSRTRQGAETMGVTSFFGLPQVINPILPPGATTAEAVDFSSNSTSSGDGAVRRKEKLTLRVAATVTDVLVNGHLKIQGSQEVRVNFELRELLVTGFVRPEDISRQNEITYDKIASARISYGGRGLISRAMTPRRGQIVLDEVLPF